MKQESLDTKAKRAKARWLKRVMSSDATPTEKCLAYIITDMLNCVSLDCWPGQETLVVLLDRTAVKTVSRAAKGLVRRGFITIEPRQDGHPGYRYAPIFLPDDRYENVQNSRQVCPQSEDTDVGESSLGILSKESVTQFRSFDRDGSRRGQPNKKYNRARRGSYEANVAELLGTNGGQVLERLSQLDDRIVDRLCRAFIEGALSQRDLAAARLAANQMNGSRGRRSGR